MSGPPQVVLFFGRLHVLLVHLPIVLILLLALLEVLGRLPRFRHVNASSGLILALAVPTALFTALCGWFLSWAGGYQDNLLQWHMWTGIATAAVCLLAGLFYRLDRKGLYRLSLFFTVAVLVVASHFGGSLTHGSDYLVRYAPAPLRAWLGGQTTGSPAPAKPKPLAETPVFAGVVQPILQQNCVACHGPDKSKAKLRLDSLAGLLKGGEDGKVLVPGKSAESDLLRRLRLPLTDQDHMPPEGKPQPSQDDIALLQWWIDAGAPANQKIAELKPPAKISRILASRFGAPGTPVKVVPPKPRDEVLPLTAKLGEQLGIPITMLSQNEPWVQCNAAVAGKLFGDAALAKLAPLAPNLRWLDLAGTAITDTGLVHIAAMPNLTRLHLERTAITDAGLASLAPLDNLEYLNLYGTQTSNNGLERLQDLPKLKQVYLWQTKVTPEAVSAFVDARTDKEQLQRWQDQIEQLKARIRDAQIAVDLGTALATDATATNSIPINTECPVSGKTVDRSKTVVYHGKLVAFCCDDCKAKFEHDAKPFLAKLGLTATEPATTKTP